MCVCVRANFCPQISLYQFSCLFSTTLNSLNVRTTHNVANAGPPVSGLDGGQRLGTLTLGFLSLMSHFAT